ncbi:hypothetical protein ABIB25_005316 [Nakamurella sp. UYEF19]|uniref:plasmid pRiA4b ORF-3 family protein n=1 Tax=Nakamurella sp. UYEF19 TaxID=1756392 RepID=UPI0033955067
MSPVSRRRKVKRSKRSARGSATPANAADAAQECDCTLCSGAGPDPQVFIDQLVEMTDDLTQWEDPLEAEILGATVMSIGERAGEGFEDALVQSLVPGFETRANIESLALLLAIGSVADERAADAAETVASRLLRAGVARPGWAAELGEPLTVSNCWRLADSEGNASMLACSFRRAGRSHAFVISVDELDCGAAAEIVLLAGDRLSDALEAIRAEGSDEGLEIISEKLDALEFRWQVERALDSRAVHDDVLTEDERPDLPSGEDGPGYPALAVLVRARMRGLPEPGKPAAPHGTSDGGLFAIPRQILTRPTRDGGNPFGANASSPARGRTVVPAMPAKRPRSDRSAPVYQLKVGLRGATPPIWRRLEVSADITLARLHTIIQIAFDWHDSHLHSFETAHGSFGSADSGLELRAETSVTLEQVAPAVNGKLRYIYDFGDSWDHDILVEKVLGPSESVGYPRCTGGRRAAPPEDCGGIWAYDELVNVLSDPSDEEHEYRLEWLGLDSALEFDPAEFDAQAVTRALSLVH